MTIHATRSNQYFAKTLVLLVALFLMVTTWPVAASAAFIPDLSASINEPTPNPVPAGSTATTSASFFAGSDTGPITVAIELQAGGGFALRLDASGTSSELTSCVETATLVTCDWDGDSAESPQTLAVFIDVDEAVLPYTSATVAAIAESPADGSEEYASASMYTSPPVGTTSLSGRVITEGGAPVDQACVFVLSSPSGVFPAITDSNGDWSVDNLPDSYSFIVGIVPPYVGAFGPCADAGPPPIPGPGELQPVFYDNIWIDLADPILTGGLGDPYTFGVAAGATSLSSSSSGIDACLSTAPSSQVPRPPCVAPATTTTTLATTTTSSDVGAGGVSTTIDPGSETLPFTGSNSMALIAAGSLAILLGVGALANSKESPSRN